MAKIKQKAKGKKKPTHPIEQIAVLAQSIGWEVVLDRKAENVEGMIVGTQAFVNTVLGKPETDSNSQEVESLLKQIAEASDKKPIAT